MNKRGGKVAITQRNAIVLLVIFCPSIAGILAQTGAGGETVPVELSTVGLDGRTGTPIVVLREPVSGGVLPIWVGVMEAQAIALALHGVVTPRPMTHDLMASLIAELRAEVDEVVVTDLRNNTYFGMVRLKVAGERKIRDVDSRPSDALALAVRTGAPIRIVRRILAIAPEFEFIAPDGPNQVVQAMGMTVVLATPSLRRQFKLGDLPGIVVTSVYGAAGTRGCAARSHYGHQRQGSRGAGGVFRRRSRDEAARAGACDLLADWRDEDNRAAG